MSLIDVFWVLLSLLVGAVVYYLTSGWSQAVRIIASILAAPAFYFLAVGIGVLMERRHRKKKLKKCPCGECQPDEYTWIGGEDGYPIREWKCGIRMIELDDGPRRIE